jgi:membrane AbrB-like protein
MARRNLLRSFLPALLLGFVAAQVCTWLNTPLPWMIGPLFATAAACMMGAPLAAPLKAREAGQWAIGTTLGLYFSAAVLGVLASYAGWIALTALFALALGAIGGWMLYSLSDTDRVTAFFAMATGGAAEMATQAERHGALVERVAGAHSVRVMLVVATIPFGVRWWSGHGLAQGLDSLVPGVASTVDYRGLVLLVLLTSIGALALKRLKAPNAWVIGPLLVAMVLTANGVHLSRVPEWMIRTGQLLIGVSLGTRFTPEFARAAPRYMASVMFCSVATMLLAGAFGLAMAAMAGIHPGTAILATSTGGIAEMALTARVLHLGVPIVTAFHVARMIVVLMVIGPTYRLFARRWGSDGAAEGPAPRTG